MIIKSGIEITRVEDIVWEDRINIDKWLSRGGMYFNDELTGLCIRLIDYPVGSTEPRHVHQGMHATTVLKGTAIVDGLNLNTLDVVLGPSNEPHGPLHYPQGCRLLSAFLGSYYHSEVQELSEKKEYRLIEQSKIEWKNQGDGKKSKVLVDHGCGKLLVTAVHFSQGAELLNNQSSNLQNFLIVNGSAVIDDENLGQWDFMTIRPNMTHGPIFFPKETTLLALELP